MAKAWASTPGSLDRFIESGKDAPVTKTILVVDTVYPRALAALLRRDPDAPQSYLGVRRQLLDAKFGMSDIYEDFFKKCGWDCTTVIANSDVLQCLWAEENLSKWMVRASNARRSALRRVPLVRNRDLSRPFLKKILVEQIAAIKPDVLFCFDLSTISEEVSRAARKAGSLIVGQTNSALPTDQTLQQFDFLISSLPFFTAHFEKLRIPSLMLDLGFDDRVTTRAAVASRDIRVSFVGGLTRLHQRTELLDAILEVESSAAFFGYVEDEIDLPLRVRSRHFGERWGIDAYDVLCSSAVTINEHGIVDPDLRFGGSRVAANMRLFEATGCGALLVTDHLPRIEDFFEVGSEVLTYRSLGELKDCLRWATANPSEARTMARRAQERTLREHTYSVRLEVLNDHLEAALASR
jgi:hypothetical protein